ncbi:MAG: low molecular weight phosphatase family protein [Acidimicrobiales bacterium]
MPSGDAAIKILVVCTGNICRSPMAEGLLRARLAERGVVATVSSAGLTWEGRSATPEAIRAASAYGVDLREHRSRILDPAHLADADLILAMERRHVREVVAAAPDRFARTFTLAELVRRGNAIGSRPTGVAVAAWLAHVGAGRRPESQLGFATDDDIADPYGRPLAAYEKTVTDLDALVARLVELLWSAATSVEEAS